MIHRLIGIAALAAVFALPAPSLGQALGTYSWQLAPFCNVVTVNVTQIGSTYTLDGYDTQCGGASNRAPLTGMAVPNPNGTIGFGLTIVTSPGGTAVHVEAAISLTSLGGTWRDSDGRTGDFVFTPGARRRAARAHRHQRHSRWRGDHADAGGRRRHGRQDRRRAVQRRVTAPARLDR